MNKLALHLPLNNLSFGQTSNVILRTLYEREKAGNSNLDLYLFNIGNVDLSAQKQDNEFNSWIQYKIVNSLETYTRDIPVFRLWHLNDSLASLSSQKQTLLSFYELDSPTKVELNIAKNNNTCYSSKYTCEIFNNFGVNSHYLPLAFDSFNYSRLDKTYYTDGRIVFNLCGKLEKRKHHAKVIRAWVKTFGNNRKFALQCAIFNPFLTPEQNNDTIKQIVGGEKPFNVNFYPTMKENYIYNDFLNSANVIIGMSGAEGWGLPEMQSVAIGKHAVMLNAHAYKDWANKENSILVNPSGKIDATDGVFFHNGQIFNQGQIFDFNEEEFIEGCKLTIKRVESDRINHEGLKLQEKFNKEQFVDNIIRLSI